MIRTAGSAASRDTSRRRVTHAAQARPMNSFGTALRPVYDRWANTIGAELVRKAEAAIRAVA